MESIGSRIRKARKTLDLSQDDFANRINISRPNLANIEAGRTNASPRVLKDICSVYHVNMDWLESGDGVMFESRNTNSEVAEMMGQILGNEYPEISKLFLAFSRLGEEYWDKLEKKLKEVSNEERE